jgi:malonyl-CoA decarboxylase
MIDPVGGAAYVRGYRPCPGLPSMINVAFLQELMNTVAEQGRQLLPWPLRGVSADDDIEKLAEALVSNRGEASGVVLARELVNRYRSADIDGKRAFFKFLARAMRRRRQRRSPTIRPMRP